MKVSTVKLYQSVEFNKRQESYFRKEKQADMADIEIKVLVGIGVEVRSSKDYIIVPFANIAFMRPTDQEVPADSKALKAAK